MDGCAGVSQGEAIEASVTAATQSPGTQQIPGPALMGGGAETGPGSSGSPTGLFFQLLSPAQGGTAITLRVCLERPSQDLAEWVNGGTHASSRTHTETPRPFGGLSVLPVGMVGKEKIM